MEKKGVEKRICRRFEIPGAQVLVKKAGLLNRFARFSEPCDLINLSKGGVGFYTPIRFSSGQKALIQLLVPDESPLLLRGQVRWQGRPGWGMPMDTGVEFAPFGERWGWNPPKALDLLTRLDGAYGGQDQAVPSGREDNSASKSIGEGDMIW